MEKIRVSIKVVCFSAILLSFACSRAAEKQTANKPAFPADVEQIQKKTVKVSLGENGVTAAEDITQGRDLTQYADGGDLDKGGLKSKENFCYDCGEKKVRDFIWKNWTEKRRAYIKLTYNGTDAISTAHIFIEPNENNQWRVAWRMASYHTNSEYGNLVTDLPTIFSVERVENKPEKGEWALVLKDKSGKTIQAIPDFPAK